MLQLALIGDGHGLENFVRCPPTPRFIARRELVGAACRQPE